MQWVVKDQCFVTYVISEIINEKFEIYGTFEAFSLPVGPNCLLAAAYLRAIVTEVSEISAERRDMNTLPPERGAIEFANLLPSLLMWVE